uniref:Innexin n=1 Tax=Bursaphelenchus xylophilus TaxID=6326 RepID=A0A1I7S8A1_BURXY
MAIRKNIVEKFDHFCDYTSIVGFRLLRSENPRWLRLSAVLFFITFAAMFAIQTKDAFLRFLDPAKVPIPTFNMWVHKNITRPSIALCSTNWNTRLMVNTTQQNMFEILIYEIYNGTTSDSADLIEHLGHSDESTAPPSPAVLAEIEEARNVKSIVMQ